MTIAWDFSDGYAPLADALIPVAHAAGDAIMQHYRQDIDVITKLDGSPTTAADAAAEAIIVEALAALTPGLPVVAEEAVSEGYMPPATDTFWLVDPLDGTREFLKKTDQFTVNIGLVQQGVPVFGIIYAPALHTLYVGYEETFRYWVNGAEQSDRGIALQKNALRVVGSRSHRSPKTDALLANLPVASDVPAGSSLKFCLIASGQADLYPRLGRTMEWDTAAGDAITRATGGQVVTLDGSPLTYNKRERGFDNPSFVVVRKGLSWPM